VLCSRSIRSSAIGGRPFPGFRIEWLNRRTQFPPRHHLLRLRQERCPTNLLAMLVETSRSQGQLQHLGPSTRHVRDAFKAMPVKTDRKDARGIAQLMRLGWFRPVHCKSVPAQEMRALLTARKLIQGKRHDIEMSLRGILRGFAEDWADNAAQPRKQGS
jgi:hypothetical protein